MIWIGNDSFLDKDKVISISPTNKPVAKRWMLEAKRNNKFLDFSNGSKKESVIMMIDGYVAASIATPREIADSNREDEKKEE